MHKQWLFAPAGIGLGILFWGLDRLRVNIPNWVLWSVVVIAIGMIALGIIPLATGVLNLLRRVRLRMPIVLLGQTAESIPKTKEPLESKLVPNEPILNGAILQMGIRRCWIGPSLNTTTGRRILVSVEVDLQPSRRMQLARLQLALGHLRLNPYRFDLPTWLSGQPETHTLLFDISVTQLLAYRQIQTNWVRDTGKIYALANGTDWYSEDFTIPNAVAP